MLELQMTADEVVSALLGTERHEGLCILDSCGTSHAGSHLLIAGMDPVDRIKLNSNHAAETLGVLDGLFSGSRAAIFTLSYDLGRKMLGIGEPNGSTEPDVYAATFDNLVIHDYNNGSTHIAGQETGAARLKNLLKTVPGTEARARQFCSDVTSNFRKNQYLESIETVKELIRRGDTYQTNLTQQFTAAIDIGLTPGTIFQRLRRDHPAPFSAFIHRGSSTVISASPELFFRIDPVDGRIITSPIKGTRPRGVDPIEDQRLRNELLQSDKDAAENTMIVDLLRNDLGRVCEFGSVTVDKHLSLEEHPSLFHLSSTISGDLRPGVRFSEIVKALFPCGSITGAPKISTMKIIDQLEPDDRGLSMGAVGCYIPAGFGIPPVTELSVAIRTMSIRGNCAVFNLGGGIVIDSDPEAEYAETLTKGRALMSAIGGELTDD